MLASLDMATLMRSSSKVLNSQYTALARERNHANHQQQAGTADDAELAGMWGQNRLFRSPCWVRVRRVCRGSAASSDELPLLGRIAASASAHRV